MENPKKIAFLLYSMTGGGEERIASLLLRHLPEDYEAELVLFNGPVDYPLQEGQSVTYLRQGAASRFLRLLSLPWLAWRYYRFCRRKQIDYSLSFDNLPNYINCLLKVFGWQGRVLLRETNFSSRRFPPQQWSGRSHRWLIRRLYPRADRIFVNARRIGQDLTTTFGIPSSLLQLHPNPLDFELIERSQSGQTKPAGFTFLHVGAFRPQKNHRLLIEAFARIARPGLRLRLIGKGPLEAAIKTQVRQLGIADYVEFLGFQSNPFQYMAVADALVLSSDFEGLPNVLLEALACGLPLIATDCPSGPREVIAPDEEKLTRFAEGIWKGRYGLLTQAADATALATAMQIMVKEEKMRKEWHQQARQGVRAFRIEKIIATFADSLNSF